ncbi:MAG: ATP phosphoribosyltransferase regulatory subunit [Acidocella sp. 20-57-95]|nr:MAG: ATP phosphoribosyltransferase regulatory subunit [Acidocella sp. 20-57-95]OYV62690.1 MAG: ATP phosphoribosyltransferase regulatory subunit [Acidocella sp. 21-58-7]HQT65295.1 ATP phosphoribosyltransferase regulatory subunit [Acidocella sp.]
MNETPANHPALLPAGLRDTLPPEAEIEAKTVESIMDCFAAHGYARVKTPLLEFEDSLFAGSGAATAEQTFRLMDPESQRMMGLRADTTPQIGRVAATRLGTAPRPLRLAYAGQCLRVRGSHLQPERQIAQAGIELIGVDAAEADAEIILNAAEALAAVGLSHISFDLTMPHLVLQLLGEDVSPALARALDRKDSAAVASLGGAQAGLLQQLLEASGTAARAMPALLAIDLPATAKALALRMAETVSAIQARSPDLALTIDPVEFRGYRYHTGICFTVFASGEQAELGRGGRYLCGDTEPATGITLYPDTIVQVAPAPALRPRIYVPYGTKPDIAATFRAHKFATVAGLAPVENPALEAARLGCQHVFQNGDIHAVTGTK